ncbi:N-acetylmuramoyl-L-alanine amidase family 2 [Caldalkalibacillus thermarum TA2.A1]|uniref:N-acetylmuramoyl-L-alanine amidase n=1 Tax=Caldalkalibacillus thermarum (strain TA2.A1) TaxID=986075 RepID=F5L301_CALTT|nr:N-acetylmuramoyl-L-alanine amidase [Caldalkalibacillus thermarum]EGL84282.1 N-acetylmuramoyl-L-alanine amidase family 2 [Caldalkalibacillus thermarum TA2.A1]
MPSIKQDLVPSSVKNVRPGYPMTPKWITIHETDNFNPGAGAKNHATWLKNGASGLSRGWHFTVDDTYIIQSIPTNESTWHAGDGPNGTGNRHSIGIEICVNPDSDYEAAKVNAAWLVRKLMKDHNILLKG